MTDPHPPAPAEARGTPNLNKALAAFQAEMPSLVRDRTVNVETKGDKPNYDYSYATLANVTAAAMPLLGKHGLSFTTFPGAGSDGKGMSLHYSLLHESGEERSGEFPMSAEGGIQILGGRITYIRRYCLLAVTGLAAEEDDDAAAAQDFDANKGTAQRRAQPPATRARKATPAAEPPTEGGQTVQRAARPVVEPPPLPGEDASQVRPPKDRGALDREAFALFRDMGVGAKEDRETRLFLVQNMLGREVGTFNDLSDAEVRGAIDAMRKAVKTDDPMTAAVAIYLRTTGTGGPAAEPVQERPETSGAQTRTERTLATITNGGDEGKERAPWEEGELPV